MTRLFLFISVLLASVAVAFAQSGAIITNTATGTTATGVIATGSTATGVTLTGALSHLGAEKSVCTMEYNPVCAISSASGATAKMYGNSCSASQDNAKIVDMAACQSSALIGGGVDKYGCKTSAGYSWDEELSLCVRPLAVDTIYDWAKKVGLTTTANVTDFAPDREITRQEVTAIIERSFSKNIFATRTLTSTGELTFEDTSAIAPEFKHSVKFAQNANIVRGNGKKFFPLNSISNYEILLMLARSASSDDKISNADAEILVKKIIGSTFDDKKFLTKPAKRSDVFGWMRQFVNYQKNKKIVSADAKSAITSGTWRLDYIIDLDKKVQQMPEETTFIVSETGFSAKICNILNGEISLADAEISLIGSVVGTRMYCESSAIRYAEQHLISKKAWYVLSDNNRILTLISDTGVKYVFSRK